MNMYKLLFYGLAASTIVFASYLLLTDYLGGNLNLKTKCTRIRIISMALLLTLSLLDILTGPEALGPVSSIVNLACAGSVILLSPHSYSKRDYNLNAARLFSVAAAGASLAFQLLGAPDLKSRLLPIMSVSLLLLHGCLCLRFRFENPKNLFLVRAPWYAIEDYAGHVFALLLLCGLCLGQAVAVFRGPWLTVALLPAMALLCVGVYGAYRKSEDSSIVFLTPARRCHIDNMMLGKTAEKKSGTGNRRAAMFSKIKKYMEEQQPYLDEGFSISDLAEAMLSNRVYISRIINDMTGNNFRAFVNAYRVEYSQKLWKKNPKLKAQEMYSRCGFHTVASFINAFRSAEGCTPSEWQKESRAECLRLDVKFTEKAA